MRGPVGGNPLPRHDDKACLLAEVLRRLDRGHRVVVGEGNQVEMSLQGRLDELGRTDHAVRGERVAVGIRDHPSKIARTKAAASNGSMSAMSSPTPTSLTDTLSSDSIGITAPPFALLSSLGNSRPVMGIALLNSRAWTRLDSPSTPSSTSSDS